MILLLGVSILALLNSIISYYLNESVPSPYMVNIILVFTLFLLQRMKYFTFRKLSNIAGIISVTGTQ